MHTNLSNFNNSKKPSIAIIGSGVSGLVLAYLLESRYQVLVLEKQDRIGGHTNTIKISTNDIEEMSVDTGFIVYNERNYPLFTQLLSELKVVTQPSEMSFSVKAPKINLEYNGHSLNNIFAQRKNLFQLSFWQFLLEITRFNSLALKAIKQKNSEQMTVGNFLDKHKFSNSLRDWYILPMAAAIWSSSTISINSFPLSFFLQFFKNHGLLELKNRPQWRTVTGGAKNYLHALTAKFDQNIILNCSLKGIERKERKVFLHFNEQPSLQVDQVAFACHSDEALSLLMDATDQEKSILSALHYQKNQAIVHQDTSIMPKSALAWASWNYLLSDEKNSLPIVTYDMNRLQSLPTRESILVTLNGKNYIDEKKILRTIDYHHPQFNEQTLKIQTQWSKISGANRTHYCGAYWFNGFHEDGVRSAMRVSAFLGGDGLTENSSKKNLRLNISDLID